ncbi:MAG: ferredoxin [Actinoplanes sp.]|jgi:ferredoxin|nr:ferredoxin [Actinoplanes sp.]
MQISVDRHRCIGAGQCVLSAPDIFDQDEDGLVRLLVPNPDDDYEDEVSQADRHCPAQAITLDD